MRSYKKREKTTAQKTYQDYLEVRKEYLNKGYYIKDKMSEEEFNSYYGVLREAAREGELKHSPWQELKAREKKTSSKQATKLAQAATEMKKEEALKKLNSKLGLSKEQYDKEYAKIQKIKVSRVSIFKTSKEVIATYGAYLNKTKESGLYGGNYPK